LIKNLTDTHGDRILEAILYATDGMTDFELAVKLDIMLSSVNGARNRLMTLGLVEARGDRRPSGRGGMAKVWHIKAGA
jgi:predicted transcriptional regulator